MASVHNTKQAKDVETALSQLTVGEVYDILVEVRAWVKRDPDGVKELLAQRPVLAQALLKMQTQMGMMQSLPPADVSFGAAATAYAPMGQPVLPQPPPMFAFPPPMVPGYGVAVPPPPLPTMPGMLPPQNAEFLQYQQQLQFGSPPPPQQR